MLTTFKGRGLIGDDHPLGCGVLGMRVDHADQLDATLEQAPACHDRPSLVEVMADQELI